MELKMFHGSLQAAKELASVVEIGTLDVNKLRIFGVGLDIISAATSGAIILCVARFEEYLKSVAERCLGMYRRAQPPIKRSQLDPELQVSIMRKNITAAAQKTLRGATRSPAEIRRDMHDVASRISGDQIWGNHAIDTHSNPSAQTVAEVLGLLGVAKPWQKIEASFSSLWSSHQRLAPSHKSVPSAEKELDSIISWRNTCAHTSQAPPIGAKEVFETIAYFESLSGAIESVLESAVTAKITALRSTPAPWI